MSQVEGLGTAGAPAGGVVSVQGVVSGTSAPTLITDFNVTKATYSASGTVVAALAATDLVTLTGSATKIIKLTRLSFFGAQMSGSIATVSIIRRSAANTGGTSLVRTATPHDSTNIAASGVVVSYTANPTALGASVGSLRTKLLAVGSLASTNANPMVPDELIIEFGKRASQGLYLRGTAQSLSINLNGGTFASNTFSFSLEWTEE